MPESAEVAINRDWLRERLVGKTLASFKFHPHSRYVGPANPSFYDLITDGKTKVLEVGIKGKFMWWHLQRSQLPPMRAISSQYLHITHGMTGGWRRPVISTDVQPHDAWEVVTSGGQATIFYDARKFGSLKVVSRETHEKKLANLGPDLLVPPSDEYPCSIEHAFWQEKAFRPKRKLMDVLVDQSVVSGIGNYLRSEILYADKCSPYMTIGELSYYGRCKLIDRARTVASTAYEAGGASIYTWRNPEGQLGKAQEQFRVYGKTHCPLNHKITKELDKAGRAIWWCKECQK